jgi:hypothetical protein
VKWEGKGEGMCANECVEFLVLGDVEVFLLDLLGARFDQFG